MRRGWRYGPLRQRGVEIFGIVPDISQIVHGAAYAFLPALLSSTAFPYVVFRGNFCHAISLMLQADSDNKRPALLDKTITQPPRRTRFVDIVQGSVKLAMNAGFLGKPDLDVDAMKARAAKKAGSADFGDPWFERPLKALVKAVESEAQLHETGAHIAVQQCEKVLVDRLWAQQWFAQHPEILSRPLRNPVFVVGPMRSGTTRLHRLLAADKRFNHVRGFETISPVPRPGFSHGARDGRIALAKRIRRVARLANPATLSIHPTGPMQPEEELGLLVNSFWGMKHEAQWFIPSYGRWCEGEDAEPVYRHMADLLRLVGWSQQASSLRPWVLKTPQHMLDLSALLKVFPDARFVFTHRDPLRVVASSASLAWNQTCIYSDHADASKVGSEWLRKTRLQVDSMQAARKHIAPDRMIDIDYEDVDTDWRNAMRRIYTFLDLDIDRAWPAMEAFARRAERLKRHPHRYSLAEFGLSEDQVLAGMGSYGRRYEEKARQRVTES